jgi:hypothetical protein
LPTQAGIRKEKQAFVRYLGSHIVTILGRLLYYLNSWQIIEPQRTLSKENMGQTRFENKIRRIAQ